MSISGVDRTGPWHVWEQRLYSRSSVALGECDRKGGFNERQAEWKRLEEELRLEESEHDDCWLVVARLRGGEARSGGDGWD